MEAAAAWVVAGRGSSSRGGGEGYEYDAPAEHIITKAILQL